MSRSRPGVDNGSKVRVAGMGGAGEQGGPAGDVYIITKVRPHPYFERKGDNLYSEAKVTVKEAALGEKIEIPTVDGMVSLTLPPGVQTGQQLKLRGKGVPHLGGGGVGDHYVTIKVVTPTGLGERGKELLRELDSLHPRGPPGRTSRFSGFRKKDEDIGVTHEPMGLTMVAREHRLFMISVVSEMLGIHPQTLRLYEREGFIKPKRSGGNTRLYSEEDVEKLEMILRLTRELGVNLAGVEVILSMREKMEQMQREMEETIQQLREELEREMRRREEMKCPGPGETDHGDDGTSE